MAEKWVSLDASDVLQGSAEFTQITKRSKKVSFPNIFLILINELMVNKVSKNIAQNQKLSSKCFQQSQNINFCNLLFLIIRQFVKCYIFQLILFLCQMILVDIAIAIMPVYAYYSQMMLIRKEKSIGSFSIYVCAILLISNILRIFFWLTVGFAVNLLFQSIFLIVIMLMLLKDCVQLSDHSVKQTSLLKRFWKWQTYEEYITFLLVLTSIMTVLTLFLQAFQLTSFGQIIGFVSMTIEAMLGFPQLISNWKSKSVKGLSYTMIGMWFLGDFVKTVYFVNENQPIQFIMCGIIQITTDIIIITQIFFYSKSEYASLQINQKE